MGVLEEVGELHYEFPELNGERKLRELIIYISDKCIDDETFGAVKLNKILYLSDFEHYAKYEIPITGLSYQSVRFGPVLERMRFILGEMERNDEIIIKIKSFYEREQHRVISMREENLEIFSAREIAVVDNTIRSLWGKRATVVSIETHGKAWEVAGEGGLIPYEAVHLSDEEITREDVLRAQELDREHGWDEF